MKCNTLFTGCLLLSMATHGTIFFSFARKPDSPQLAPTKPLEIRYQKSMGDTKEGFETLQAVSQESYKTKPREQQKLTHRATASVNKFIQNEIFTKRKNLRLAQKVELKKAKPKPLKKYIDIPEIPGEIFNMPEYQTYYQKIREPIRKLAHRYYRKIEEGLVVVRLSIDSNGKPFEIKINELKSVKNKYLCQVALKSIQQAAPFPPFPMELQENKALSFDIIITFELK